MENITDGINKTEDLFSKCSDQVQVNSLPQSPSKLTTTCQVDYNISLANPSFSILLTSCSCFFIFTPENLENLTIFEVFRG